MCKTKWDQTTRIPEGWCSCSDQAVGFHHSRLGHSPQHSTEGIPPAHDKSSTHIQPLSLLPPTATFTQRDACVYVHMCHGQQPLTRHTAPRQKDFTERKGVGEAELRGKWGEKRSDGAPEHARVRLLCHKCDEVIDGNALC